MNRFLRPIIVALLVVAGCAPSGAPATPAPVPAPAAPPPAAPPVVTAPTTMPENWWLLDPAASGVPGTSVERAYAELLGGRRPARNIVVAIIDSGVDVEHEDLDGVIWVNGDEVAGNGRDDDGNGYVDDVNGWSFLGGPSGENVEYDTYEVTRLYAQCRARNALNTPECSAIAADFEAERAEAEEYLSQYRQIATTQAAIVSILEAQLNTDSLTREAVAGLQTSRPDVAQARQIFLQLYDAGATPEVIEEGIEALSIQVEYGYNPDFDPRAIVGDNYQNQEERIYGNSDVEGPAADHGTLVAGIVAAERRNGIGVDGIATGVELMVIRAVPNGDERDKDVANAIRYAVDNGADIINMSFGKSYSPGKALVDEAVRHAVANGVLLVHAAGNDGADLDEANNFPNPHYVNGGRAELWLQVGAAGWMESDLAASFSNYGRTQVDVFAPGVDIFSTAPDNGYETTQGTSMAAPVVSGLAALIMAYHPNLSAARVREIILETATRYPGRSVAVPGGGAARAPFSDLSVTGGVVNGYAALRRAAELDPPR